MIVNTYRCSSLPTILRCAAASVPPTVDLRIGGTEAADLGTAVHHVVTEGLAGRGADHAEVAARHGVEASELSRLVAWFWRQWETVAEWFPCPETEYPLAWTDSQRQMRLTGTLDVFQPGEGLAFVSDLKTGRLDLDASSQLSGYAFLVVKNYPEVERVCTIAAKIRSWSFETVYYERSELEAWWEKTARHLMRPDVFQPGFPQCGYCKRGHECQARESLLEQSVRSILGIARGSLPSDPVELGATLHVLGERAKFVQKACDLAMELRKAVLAEHGGALPTGDGRELAIIETETRELSVRQSLPILREVLTDDQVQSCLKLGKGAVEKAVAANAPRGQKGQAVADVLERLEAAGAVLVKAGTKVEMRGTLAVMPQAVEALS